MRSDDAARALGEYDGAETVAMTILLRHAAQFDGHDSAFAGPAFAGWLDRQPISRYALASLLASAAIRLHRTGRET